MLSMSLTILTLTAASRVSPAVVRSGGGGGIVGGAEAEPGEFPHLVAVLRGGPGGALMCGGSLVAADRVVTAAHCCDGQRPSNLAVRVGSFHRQQQDPDQADIAVTEVRLHEDYDPWALHNDICVLELAAAADLTSPSISVVAVPPSLQQYEAGTLCTVAGWGTTTEGGAMAEVVMKVEVPVVTDEECREAYGEDEIADSQLCAGRAEGGADACQGDDGAALLCGGGLDGVVSWGYGCARPGLPGIYTQTSYFTQWILQWL